MAKGNSIYEHTNVRTVELFIIESLLKGENVVIPDFGHLEVKSLGDRHTVLFKSNENNDSFLRIMSVIGEKYKKETNALFTVISVPLKEEKVVNLPQIGIFRPVKRENEEIHVTFILSSFLRNLLNKDEKSEEILKEVKREIEEAKNMPSRPEKKDEIQKAEIISDKENLAENSGKSEASEILKTYNGAHKPSSNSPHLQKGPRIGDTLVPQDDFSEKSKSKSMSGTLLLIAAVIALIIFVILYFFNKGEDKEVLTIQQNEIINLPALSEQYYGHSAFWIYIYEANSDKLNSPVNIPKKAVSFLVFPDLKVEFDVDVTDSMEIQRANILSDIVLKKIKNVNK